MFRAVINDRVDQWAQQADHHAPEEGQSLRDRLLHHGMFIAQTLPHPEAHAFQRLLISTREKFPELSLAMYESGSRPLIERVARDIENAARQDNIVAKDPMTIATLFVSAMTGWQLQEGAARTMTRTELENIARRIVDLFLLARAGW